MELGALRIFPPFCTRDTTFVNSYLLPLQKRIYSKRNEFAPKGSKFFTFRDLFSEGRQKSDKVTFPEGVTMPPMRDMHRMPMILCCTEQKQQNLWKRLVLTKTIFFLLTPKTDQELTKCCNVNFRSET